MSDDLFFPEQSPEELAEEPHDSSIAIEPGQPFDTPDYNPELPDDFASGDGMVGPLLRDEVLPDYTQGSEKFNHFGKYGEELWRNLNPPEGTLQIQRFMDDLVEPGLLNFPEELRAEISESPSILYAFKHFIADGELSNDEAFTLLAAQGHAAASERGHDHKENIELLAKVHAFANDPKRSSSLLEDPEKRQDIIMGLYHLELLQGDWVKQFVDTFHYIRATLQKSSDLLREFGENARPSAPDTFCDFVDQAECATGQESVEPPIIETYPYKEAPDPSYNSSSKMETSI